MSKELYKQSETVNIKRSQIKFATYNPKKHSKQQVDEIKSNMKRVAFLGGIVWNELTGNLVDGHKRVQALDLLHKYDGNPQADYLIKVEKISLAEKIEKEQNIFQARSQTEFDQELMRDLVPQIDYQNAGLDLYDLNLYGIDISPFEHEPDFSPINQPILEKKEAVKAAKQQIQEKAQEKVQNLDSYLTLSFGSRKAKSAFMLRFGFHPLEKFIKGETFSQMIERIE